MQDAFKEGIIYIPHTADRRMFGKCLWLGQRTTINPRRNVISESPRLKVHKRERTL